MNNPKTNESESPTVEDLEKAIATFDQQIKDNDARIRELLIDEDIPNGIYHHEEIFTCKQDMLRLKTEIIFRKNKIARINYAQ